MFLSNSLRLVIVLASLVGFSQGCSGTQTVVNSNVPPPVEESGRFPFSLREPDVYQADIVVTTLGTETRYFVARKGANSRLDYYKDGKLSTTDLGTDAIYEIDHTARNYVMTPTGSGSPPVVTDEAKRFFRGRMPYRYDELDRKEGVIRYKARDHDIIVSIDEATGLMVRQEFSEDGEVVFLYELRNVKTDVDDTLFQLPAGYRRINK